MRAYRRARPPNVSGRLLVHLVVDNYATHKHPKVRAWLKRHPRFHLHFTPTSASWINLVERFFGLITDDAIRRGVFHSVAELNAAIEAYLEQHNAAPKPFVWTAPAADILEKVARGRQALKLVHQQPVGLEVRLTDNILISLSFIFHPRNHALARPALAGERHLGAGAMRLLDGRGAAQGRGHSSVDGQGPDAVGGLATIARAGDDGRPDAAVAMGLQEPRQAGDGASRHGSQSEFLDHSQAAGGTEILSPFQPQDQGSRQTS